LIEEGAYYYLRCCLNTKPNRCPFFFALPITPTTTQTFNCFYGWLQPSLIKNHKRVKGFLIKKLIGKNCFSKSAYTISEKVYIGRID